MNLEELPGLFFSWKYEKDFEPSSLSVQEKLLADAISHERRKKQFTLGRQALKEALERAGFKNQFSILKGGKGEPVLPEGFCGSISHSNGTAVAAAAKRTDILSVGVDIEHKERTLKENILSSVASDNEKKWLTETDTNLRTLMLVSAKEALYKMLYPECLKYFGLHDAELNWIQTEGRFQAVLLKDLSEKHVSGRAYLIDSTFSDNFIVSTAVLEG
jgi:enterobactin synthetase component D